jgi:hypothetical protein
MMAHDKWGEIIGIGEPLASTTVRIQLNVISECRPCGHEIASKEATKEFDSFVPFDDFQDWLDAHDGMTQLSDFMWAGVKRLKNRREGEDA